VAVEQSKNENDKNNENEKKEVSEGKQDNNMDQEDEGDLFQRDFLPNEKNLKKKTEDEDLEDAADEYIYRENINYQVLETQKNFTSDTFSRKSIGNYFEITENEEKLIFPEGWSGKLKEHEFMGINKNCLMIRNTTIDIIEYLQQAKNDLFSDKYIPKLLDGFPGVGKSAILQQVVYWARKSGWIVLFIKNGGYWVHDGGYITKSKLMDGCWNQPLLASVSLERIIKAHGVQLSKIPIRNKFILPNFDGKTLLDLAEYGSTMLEFATDAFVYLKNELSRTYEYPVLIAIDNYNALYNYNQEFRDPESKKYKKEKLHNSKLALTKIFLDSHIDPHLVNGTFVGSLTGSITRRHFDNIEVKSNYEVPQYNMEEMKMAFHHYKQTGYIVSEITPATREVIFRLCDGLPSELWKFCRTI